MSGNRIRLSICGCDFAVCSEDDETYVRSVADEVEKALGTLTEKNERLSLTMAAVITAMNYCDMSHKASASADNLRAQIKNYLEDSSHARMDAEESHRELEKIRKENQTLRARLAAMGTGTDAAAAQQPSAAAEPAAPDAESLSKVSEEEQADQENFMSFFEKKSDEP